MRRVSLVFALALLLARVGPLPAQQAGSPAPPPRAAAAEAAPPPSDSFLSWLGVNRETPVTCGDPAVTPELWQHTWGFAAVDVIPVGNKMAPNGAQYDPLFSLDLMLNVALTRDRTWYAYTTGRFWAQKPGAGITNPSQGQFDFSKRQYDLNVGLAWNFYESFEGRVFAYSFNNLNRGFVLDRPYGFIDGAGVEVRWYFPSTNFDQGLFRFLSIGYLPTKELMGQDGEAFKPSLFLSAHLAYDFIPERFYVYTDTDLYFERPAEARLLLVDPGIACRPFESCPCLEFRAGCENVIDLGVGITRSFLYGQARIVW
jgi:hypothetical protein